MGKTKKSLWLKLVIYIILIFVGILTAGPFYWLVKTSLETSTNVFKYPPSFVPHPITLENYVGVWKVLELGRYYLNSIIIAGFGTFANVFLALLAAYPMARLDYWGKRISLLLVLIPMMIPVQGTLIVNYLTLRKLHLLNSFAGVIIPQSVSLFGIFLMRQAYLGIPRDLEDAARIDGAGEFYIWWKIMTPLVKPTVVTLALFQTLTWWDSFLWPLIVLSSPNKYPLSVALVYLNSTFQTNFRYTTAGMVLAVIPVILLFLFTQKYIISGITEGAVKY
ncbi:MAG: putative chitobiose transport system permease protein [Thermotogota bacterium]|nr:putative chitobiose transport system permease protein [Thermotogota bacterium]